MSNLPNFQRYARRSVFQDDRVAARVGMKLLAMLGSERAEKFCDHHDLRIERAAGESSGTAGGFLVPDEMMSGIVDVRETYGSFRAASNIVPMRRDMIVAPRAIGALTATFTAENTAIGEANMNWDGVQLTPAKLAILNRASSEFVEDAAVDYANLITLEAGRAFAIKEDSVGYNGTGTPSDNGTVGICTQIVDGSHNASKVIAATGHDTFAEIDSTDITNLMCKLPSVALPGARWFCSQLAFALVFCRLAMSSGGIAMMKVNGRLMPHFLGFPVQITQALPQVATDLSGQVMLLFGDLELAAMLGERRGVTLAVSTQRYLDLDQIAFKVSERVDVNIHSLGDNSTAGPIVGLVGE